MKVKSRFIQIFCLVALILLGVSELSPTASLGNQFTENDKAYWTELAVTAWQYFQPGVGVNPRTGLHSAGLEWPYFTEWDLGTYIQAMIDARYLGILQRDGSWGFDARVGAIISFLKTRKLTTDGVPYTAYDSRNGEPSDLIPTFSIDEGKLIMALYNLKIIRPDLTQDIDYVVKVRQNCTELVPDPKSWLNSTDLYTYYIALAFKAFEFEGWDVVPSSIIGTITSRPNVTAYGVELPMAHISCEPLLHTMFEINPQDPRFAWLVSQVYLASEARYKATGHYTAFSEGNTGLIDLSYVYEFVVDYDGSTWKVASPITPIAYFKVAVGFHAIFNTEYTKNMVDYIGGKLPPSSIGFQEGVAEDGRVVDITIDRTNGLAISAARYAIENIPSPTPSPSPTPTVTPTPIPSYSPSFSPSPTPSVSSSPSPSMSSSPSLSPAPTTTPPVGWTIEPIMLVLLVVVAAVAWLLLFIPLMILLKRNGSRSSGNNHKITQFVQWIKVRFCLLTLGEDCNIQKPG